MFLSAVAPDEAKDLMVDAVGDQASDSSESEVGAAGEQYRVLADAKNKG